MILLIYIILLPTMHTNAGEGEDGGAGRSHEERTRELEIGKGATYAVPFRGATVAMEAVPRRGVYREWGEKKEKGGENVGKCKELCPLRSSLMRSSLIKLSQSLMHGASPWRGFRAPRRGAMTLNTQ